MVILAFLFGERGDYEPFAFASLFETVNLKFQFVNEELKVFGAGKRESLLAH